MVEKDDKVRRRLAPQNIEEIRFWRFCGLTHKAVAEKLGLTQNIIQHAISKYGLDRPLSELDVVRLEVSAVFRDTSRRLLAADLSAGDHARLSATQIKLATVLMRLLSADNLSEEDGMSRKSEAEKQRILQLTDEEILNELRSLAGLESKSARDCRGHVEQTSGELCSDEPVSCSGQAGPEAADGD